MGHKPRFLPRLQSREKEHRAVRRVKFDVERVCDKAYVEQPTIYVWGYHRHVPYVFNPLNVLAVESDQPATAHPSILPRLQSRERESEEAQIEVIASMTLKKQLMRIEMYAFVATIRENVIKVPAANVV